MATTEQQQQLLDYYSNASAEMQQKMYNAWNKEVKALFDSYNAQNSTNWTNTNVVSQTTQNQNNQTIQPTVSTQNNSNNQNQTTVQQQWALKPLSQDYYNQSGADNLSTIVSNLNNYRQTNPEYFTDYNSFKKNFSYDARNDVQKQTLDTWYNGYQKWIELNSKTVSDLATQYKGWLISDSDLEQLRTANQQKYGEVMQYINKQTILSKYDEESTPSSSTNPFQWIIDQYYANMLYASQTNATSEMFENYKNQMNSPEMTELSDQLADKEWEIKEYQMELNRIKSDVEKRYAGTWASRSKINAIIADESYHIQELMNTANLEYNTLATKYNNRMTQYQNEFQLQLQEYEYNMKARNQQMQELWFVMDLMNFETNEQRDEREWNNYVRQYDYQYWNINSKDYASRRKAVENAVQDVLTEFSWITMIRSKDQMVEDIMNLVDGWMSLWEAITKNIREPIMQKPEYEIWSANKLGTTSWVSIGWVNYNYDANWNLIPSQYNWPQYTAATQEQFDKAYQQLQSLWNGSWWWQCGSFVNNYLQDMWIGRLYTDPIEAKKAVVNSTIPTIWSVAVIDWTNNPNASEAQKQYGHVWIVVGINGNQITLKQSNNNGDETIFTSTYDASQIYWYFDPRLSIEQANSQFNGQSTQSINVLSSTDEAKKQNYLEAARRWRVSQSDTIKIWDLAAEQWWGDEWREALNKWLSVDLTETQINRMDKANTTFQSNSIVKEFEDALNQVWQLIVALNDNSWVWDMSAIFTFMKTLDPSSVVRESEFQSAANTAWVLNAQAIWQKLEKSYDWKFLTPQQREDFKKIAKEFIKVKANNYQTKYDELLRQYSNYWIDASLAPTNMANEILKQLWEPTYDFSNLWTSNNTSVTAPNGITYTRPS